jgi:prevent-host-death family protein
MSPDDTFSTYDAKARFSEVIRRVREGRTVTVTYRGEPVAEIRPLGQTGGTSARMEWLRSRGVLKGPQDTGRRFSILARRPGALARFLAERDE